MGNHNFKMDVRVPFRFCDRCKEFDLEQSKFYNGDEAYLTINRCANEEICEHVIRLFLETMPIDVDVDGHLCRYSLNVERLDNER